jgi:hypothetical protein
MKKKPEDRRDQTLDFIEEKAGPGGRLKVQGWLANHPDRTAVSKAIGLGGIRGPMTTWNPDETIRRKALRSVLLAYLASDPVTLNDVPAAAAALKAEFGRETEEDLEAQLTWFLHYDQTTVAQQVVQTARTHLNLLRTYENVQGWGRCLEWRRGGGAPNGFNCFSAVVWWAFQGGAISRRWLRTYWAHPLTHERCAELLKVDQAAAASAASVPPGLTTIFQQSGNVLGHTVLSIGAGRCVSHNSVSPGAMPKEQREEANQDEGSVWYKMVAGIPHEITLVDLKKIYAPPGYDLKAVPQPFWEYYPVVER